MAIGCGFYRHYIQSTDSMLPAIGIGDHLGSINIKSDSVNPIKRFDIVVYKFQPNKVDVGEGAYLVHRVIGLPNEKVEVKAGKVFVNDKILDEPFEKIRAE